MEQYISKSALVAEIERLIKKNELYLDDNVSVEVRYQKTGAYSVLCDIRHFIDTLEAKKVDLNKETSNYLGDDWRKDADGKIENEMIAFAKHFFELGMAVSNKQIEEKEDINSPEEECNTIYKDIVLIDRDGNRIKAKIEQRKKV